jgi:catechol 2,3-dioxygenase-like lactoylglutathione lyase family enzyme
MILACHALIYSDDADATRAFFRDVMGFPCVDAGTGDHNWLIFGTGPSELGVHPTGSAARWGQRTQAPDDQLHRR